MHLAETVQPRSRLAIVTVLVAALACVVGLRHAARPDPAPHRDGWRSNVGQCVNGRWVTPPPTRISIDF